MLLDDQVKPGIEIIWLIVFNAEVQGLLLSGV